MHGQGNPAKIVKAERGPRGGEIVGRDTKGKPIYAKKKFFGAIAGGQKPIQKAKAAESPEQEERMEAEREKKKDPTPPPLPAVELPGKVAKKSGVDELVDFAKGGGSFIGPRGGKWADSAMTIPYSEKHHGKQATQAKEDVPGMVPGLQKDVQDCKRAVKDISILRQGGKVENLSMEGAKSKVEGLAGEIKNKINGKVRKLYQEMDAKETHGAHNQVIKQLHNLRDKIAMDAHEALHPVGGEKSCDTPGMKIRSGGKGQGQARGGGKGPIGRMGKSGLDELGDFAKALFIGPKGGRWADPQHTVPYDEDKHGGGKKPKGRKKPTKSTQDRQARLKQAEDDLKAGPAKEVYGGLKEGETTILKRNGSSLGVIRAGKQLISSNSDRVLYTVGQPSVSGGKTSTAPKKPKAEKPEAKQDKMGLPIKRGDFFNIEGPNSTAITARKTSQGGYSLRIVGEQRMRWGNKKETMADLAHFKEHGVLSPPEKVANKSGIDQLDDFAKGGGLFIGPRGGKWADAKHTIPWDEGSKKQQPTATHAFTALQKQAGGKDKVKAKAAAQKLIQMINTEKFSHYKAVLPELRKIVDAGTPSVKKKLGQSMSDWLDEKQGKQRGGEPKRISVESIPGLSKDLADHKTALKDLKVLRAGKTVENLDMAGALHNARALGQVIRTKIRRAVSESKDPVSTKKLKAKAAQIVKQTDSAVIATNDDLARIRVDKHVQSIMNSIVRFDQASGMQAVDLIAAGSGSAGDVAFGIAAYERDFDPATMKKLKKMKSQEVAFLVAQLAAHDVPAVKLPGLVKQILRGPGKVAKKSGVDELGDFVKSGQGKKTKKSEGNNMKKSEDGKDLKKGMVDIAEDGRGLAERWACKFHTNTGLEVRALECAEDSLKLEQNRAAWRKKQVPDRERDEWPRKKREAYADQLVKERVAFNEHADEIDERMAKLDSELIKYRIKEAKRFVVKKGGSGIEQLGDFAKSKYIKRTGTPGNYKYEYPEDSKKPKKLGMSAKDKAEADANAEAWWESKLLDMKFALQGLNTDITRAKSRIAAVEATGEEVPVDLSNYLDFMENNRKEIIQIFAKEEAKKRGGEPKRMIERTSKWGGRIVTIACPMGPQAPTFNLAEFLRGTDGPRGAQDFEPRMLEQLIRASTGISDIKVLSVERLQQGREGKKGALKELATFDQSRKTKKSEETEMSGIGKLASYAGEDEEHDADADLEKAQTMPKGNPKKKLGEGEEQGGELAGVGETTGSSDSDPGPGQDIQGQVTGTGTGKDKLSEDDEEDEGQMKPHKKPIESARKSMAIPGNQRAMVAQENAQEATRLQKAEPDTAIVGTGLPEAEVEAAEGLEKATEGRQGMIHYSDAADIQAAELAKSEGFYSGASPKVLPFSRPIGSGKVCAKCGTLLSKSLTACPNCGNGVVIHRVVPGGEAQGDHDGEPIVKSRSGALRPRRTEDVEISN